MRNLSKNKAETKTREAAKKEARALALLARPGASVTPESSPGLSGFPIIAPVNGVSMRIGSLAADICHHLISSGVLEPTHTKRTRYQLSEAGRAKARRNAAPVEAEPFREQHQSIAQKHIPMDGADHIVRYDESESPLAWLARRKGRSGQPMISPVELEAGERLRRDLTIAQMLPRTTSHWGGEAVDGGGTPMDFSDKIISARQRATRALDAAGPELSGLLVDICGFLKGLEQIETERRWPARSAKLVLHIALSRLARHYGLAEVARGPARSKSLLHWGAENYRPDISEALQQ